MSITTDSTQSVLNEIRHQLESTPTRPAPALDSLASHLRSLKREQSDGEWNATIEECRTHSLCGLLHQDPPQRTRLRQTAGLPRRCRTVDIIYGRDYRPYYFAPVTELGDSIFRYLIECKAPSAVRFRRDFVVGQIDHVCATNPAAHILSVACGHLREAKISRSVQTRAFGRFVGLDHDPESLNVVTRACGDLGVEAMRGSVKTLLSGCLAFDKFDLIYTADLYDYLEERLAQRLTTRLFEMLRPRGRLLIANYLPDLEDVGYMEIYADWRLIYRDAMAMRRLTETIAAPIASIRIFSDTSQTVVYLSCVLSDTIEIIQCNRPMNPSGAQQADKRHYRIAIAEDDELMREGISCVVAREKGFKICGVAVDKKSTLALVEEKIRTSCCSASFSTIATGWIWLKISLRASHERASS